MTLSSVAFKSDRFLLEGIISTPEHSGTKLPAIIVCHSHPAFGGNMHEPLVSAICQSATIAGVGNLKFNFRANPADSTEKPRHLEEFQQDLKAAIKLIRKWPGIDKNKITVVGYSFGAAVVLDGYKACKQSRKFVLISPPPKSLNESNFIRDKRSLLIITGENDLLAPPEKLMPIIDIYKSKPILNVISGADFSLIGHENEIGDTISKYAMD
mgnify:CR=1 FL=1